MATTALEATLLQRLLWLDITFKSFSITLLLVLIGLFDQTFGSIQESVTHHSADSITPFASGFPIARVYVAVQEELSPGAIITELSTHPLVKNLITQTDGTQFHETFQYRLMNAFDSHLFRITGNSGQLTIATRLDREALCASQKAQFCCNNRAQIPSSLMSDESWKLIESVPKSQLCHLVAHISLQPNKPASQSDSGSGQTGVAQINRLALVYLYIRLDDINDHAPQFASSTTTLNIAEDATVGSVLQYFRVTDPDAGANGLRDVKLSVAPLSGTSLSANSRTIEPVRGISTGVLANPFDVRLSRDGASLLLQSALDRESIPAYDLTLTALDGDPISPKSSQLNLRVLVTDANDNAPTWVRPLVNANKLQPENADVHIIDQAIPQFNVSVSEDTQVGALVFWLQARDADVGDNARLTYAIDTGAPGGLTALNYFSVQSTTGEVRLRAQLDYDSASANSNGAEIEVPITVQDNPHIGRPLMARAVLFVRILDVNDIHPIIVASPLSPVPLRRPFLMNAVPSQYTSFGVWENQLAGQPVASILVSDPDTGGGGKVSCSVQSDYFRLASESIKTEFFETIQSQSISNYPFSDGELISGPITYQLISTQILDREHIPRHQVLLTCRDHDQSKPLVSTRRLDIEVLDENDNAPEFIAPLIELTCPENSPPGQIIGVVNATDKDVGENARLRFWVNEASSSWISIHQQTGEVRVNTVFDREQETERRFTVFVSDSVGSTAHTASAEVCIRILDENDHSPQFVDLYFFSVSENSPPGTEIGQVKAEDADSGENGKVYYSLRQPSKEFEINKNTGKLTVRSARSDVINLVKPDFTKSSFTLLDREQQDSYELAIVAEDGGDPPRRATTIIHIAVSDVNDHAPQFRYPIPHGPGSVLNVSCAQLSNQIIARVHANDSDSGQNGEIEYSIIRDISINNRPKREPEPAIVKVRNDSDSGSQASSKRDVKFSNEPSKSNETKDRNPSSPPPISSSSRSVANRRQFHSSPIPSTIVRGPTTDNFEINSYNGQIFLIHPIEDCSRPADVRLLIQAKDRGSPPQSSTALLTIHINPTEQSDMYPLSAANGLDSHPHDRITLADKVSDSNTWSSRQQSGYERRFQRKSSVSNPDSSVHFLSGSSHWSAIVGLVVAMVILVLLLCLMLVILRRRFILEDQKVTIGKDGGMGRNSEKPGEISPVVRTMDGSRAGLYYKGSQSGHSMHEMKTGSPPQRSLSPTTLTRLDDINCSSVTLELGPQAMLNTHYFCTMPPSTTHTTLNSGELGTVQREGRMQPALRENPLGFSPPTQVIYRAANGDLYGYVEPQPQNNLTKGGHTYQTLQLNQRSKTLNPNTLIQPSHSTFRGNNDCFQRNILVENGQQAYNKTGHYTPLLGTANSSDMFRLLQASQPDLTEKRLATGSGSDDKLIQLVSDRAFSLTDLTPSKTDEMKSEDQAAESGAEALRSFKQRDRTKSSQTKCSQQKPSSKNKTISCVNPSSGAQPRIYNTHSPSKTMAKSVTVNIEPRRGSSPLETYNAASFV